MTTKQLAFYFDASACMGCKACQIACKDQYDLPPGVMWRRVLEYGGGDWVEEGDQMVPEQVFSTFVSIACNHCEQPICMRVCPTTAIRKGEDGLVQIDPNLCIGCRYCEWSCPYGAPHFREDLGVMTKCTFCEDLLKNGERPACVDACVHRCLDFGEKSDLEARYGDLNAIEPLPKGEITHPSIVITPHRNSQKSGEGTGTIQNLLIEL